MREKACIAFICQICYIHESDNDSETCKKWKEEPPLTDREGLITASPFVSATEEKWGTIIYASAFFFLPGYPTCIVEWQMGPIKDMWHYYYNFSFFSPFISWNVPW